MKRARNKLDFKVTEDSAENNAIIAAKIRELELKIENADPPLSLKEERDIVGEIQKWNRIKSSVRYA